MSASTSLAPFDASTLAVARPIPLAPPVTTAPLPLSVSMAPILTAAGAASPSRARLAAVPTDLVGLHHVPRPAHRRRRRGHAHAEPAGEAQRPHAGDVRGAARPPRRR